MGLAMFDELRLPDVTGKPRMREAAGQWFRDIVKVAFGSWDPETERRFIRDIFLLAPKGQAKTTFTAGLMLVAMMMNQREQAEMLFVGPTQAISDRAFAQAVGMIEASPDMAKRFKPREHLKLIEDLAVNGAAMKVKTFDVSILTGAIPVLVLIDELHLLGKKADTQRVLRQIRGGLEKRPEGLLIITTTQSDEQPCGAFLEELTTARKTRDDPAYGRGKRPLLPVLYEFPTEIARHGDRWQDPALWHMVMPNLGRSVHLSSLCADWESERAKGAGAVRLWASQHLNIEIGLALHTDRWRAADFWEAAVDDTLSLDGLLKRSEVVAAGIDGGGLDDLLALGVIGRERETRRWLLWAKAWAHRGVLQQRQSVASQLHDFETDRDLVFVDDLADANAQLAEMVASIEERGLLSKVGVDMYGCTDSVDALAQVGIVGDDRIVGISQGWKLNSIIKAMEVRVSNRTLLHGGQRLMTWCVGNAKVVPQGNAISITKAAAGTAKIDPLVAAFCAGVIMNTNPEVASGFVYTGM